jgi:hypothetical protein
MPPLLALAAGRKVRPRRAPLNRPLESRLQFDAAKLLDDHILPDWRYSHFPAGERRDVVTGARLKRFGLKKGWPDFLLISPAGQLHCLELKRIGETLTRLSQLGRRMSDFRVFCVEKASQYNER